MNNQTQCPYEENDYLYNSAANKAYGDVLQLSDAEYRQWIEELRETVVYAWDDLGIPPTGGQDADTIIDQFRRLAGYDVAPFLQRDELTFDENCIVNSTSVGSVCNQFFPTMMKTKDISSKDLKGVSIYDHFADDGLLDKFVSVTQKRFQNDDIFLYSKRVEKENPSHAISATTGKEWIKGFGNRSQQYHFYDFWLEPKRDNKRYKNRQFLNISQKELEALKADGFLSKRQLCRVDLRKAKSTDRYRIRLYQTDKRVFPSANQVFRLGLGLFPATNFPPLTAKFLYRKFTDHIADQSPIIVYDPSAGWGGRILGAMSLFRERNIHYVGTDPNPDHWMKEDSQTKYAYLADYFNANVLGRNKNTYEIFRHGSEVIHEQEAFQKYKGQLDFVFTSPPYFAAEGYSDDENQSYLKFPEYGLWRDGFLRRTLQTCAEYLKSDRWLCWNIADVGMGQDILPMEKDTIDILVSLGMEYHGSMKMVLKSAPGGNKVNWRGVPTTKNFAKINGSLRKSEPVLMFRKP